MDEALKRLLASKQAFDPEATEIMETKPIPQSQLDAAKKSAELDDLRKLNMKKTLDPAKTDMINMDTEIGESLESKAKKQFQDIEDLKELKKANFRQNLKELSRIRAKKGPKLKSFSPAGIASFAAQLLGSGGALGEGVQDKLHQLDQATGGRELEQGAELLERLVEDKKLEEVDGQLTPEQFEILRNRGTALENGGVLSKEDKEARKRALLEKAIANRNKRMEANRRENELMGIADNIVKDTRVRQESDENNLANEKRLNTLDAAMEDAKTPEFKERIRQLIMRRR